jgi:hypothetical protein|tara:strand:+ start:1503 stop:1862 length:360 start_codon:yes stop_codon:yes gene_type:complete
MSIYALEDENDFAAYLDPNYGHGQAATYTRFGSGSSSSINVIINEEYLEGEGETVNVESTTPVAVCRSIDVPNAAHSDTLVVSARKDLDGNVLKAQTTYTVVGVQPDRTGFTVMVLEEQ